MLSNVIKIKSATFAILLLVVFETCNQKSDFKNQITIKLNSIDSKTKQLRINKFDTIEVSKSKFGLFARRYVKVAEYVTNPNGSVKIKLDSTERYCFSIRAPYHYGTEYFTEDFTKEILKDGSIINLEVQVFDPK
jgi:hypothetical protein